MMNLRKEYFESVEKISEWTELEKLEFPPFIGASTTVPIEIFAFTDACQDGYCAVVYAKTEAEIS